MKYHLIKGKYLTGTKFAILTLASGFFTSAPSAIAANGINYSYFEAGYFDINDSGLDPKGYSLKGSYQVSNNFFVFAETKQGEAESVDFNNNKIEFDFDRLGYGLGYQSDLSKNSSWFVSYSRNKWEIAEAEWDVDIIRAGLRGQLTDNLELNASLTHNRIDYGTSDEDESGYQLGMMYNLSDSVSVTANYETIDEVDEASIGIRYSF